MAKKRSGVISVLITGDSSGLNRALDDTSSKLATFGKVAGAALAGAGLAFGAFAKSGLEAAIATEAAQERLATLLRNTGLASEEQIKALNAQAAALEQVGVATGSNITVLQSQLATFDLSASAIEKLTPAIVDYVIAEKGAAATADDFQAAANGLAQALQGNFGALSRVGFVLDDTTKEMIKNGTEAQRAAALVDVLSSTYGGFNEKARDTAAGGLQAMKNQFGAIQESVGTALLPVLHRFIDWFERNGPAIQAFADRVIGALLQAIEWVGDKFEEWRPKVQAAVDFVRGKIDEFKGFFEENLAGPLDAAREKIEGWASTVQTKLTEMVDGVGTKWGEFKDFFSGLDFDDPEELGRKLGEALGNAVRIALSSLANMGEQVGTSFVRMMAGVDWFRFGMDSVVYIMLFINGLIAGFFGTDWYTPLLRAFAENWQVVLIGVVSIMFMPAKWAGAIAKAIGRIPLLGKMLSWIVTSLNKLGGSISSGLKSWVWDPFAAAFSRILNTAGPGLISRFSTLLRGIPVAFRTAFDDALLRVALFFDDLGVRVANALLPLKSAWTRLLDEVALTIRGFITTLREIGQNMVRGIWEGISSMGSWLIRQFRTFIDDAVKGVKNLLGIQSPSVVFAEIGMDVGRGLAAGIARSAGMVADAMSGLSGVASGSFAVEAAGVRGGARGGAAVNITVNGALDAEGTARQVLRVLQDAERRTGVRL
jgi:hypothetical protein